ncbi:hypothetical protein [Halobacteriovorax sp. HLS]|uniref:hypothetical protein n=1 Tax=Halobacteriovorax sp. HLS TaxID=2234000 RepID=UPI000FD86610|nr:hypothetical protein [Halobacteriovorax sp. HLS]
MNISQEELVSRLVTLIRLDAKNLFERIRDREVEYLTMYSLKRTRSHFPAVFRSRFKNVQIGDLKFLSTELIVALTDFYEAVDKMEWYLTSTEDMPQTVDDRVHFFVKSLKKKYDLLALYLEGESTVSSDELDSMSVKMNDEEVEPNFFENSIEDSFEEISDDVLNDVSSS